MTPPFSLIPAMTGPPGQVRQAVGNLGAAAGDRRQIRERTN